NPGFRQLWRILQIQVSSCPVLSGISLWCTFPASHRLRIHHGHRTPARVQHVPESVHGRSVSLFRENESPPSEWGLFRHFSGKIHPHLPAAPDKWRKRPHSDGG